MIMKGMKSTFLLLNLLIGVQTFHIKRKSNSRNHQEITRIAILRVTERVCQSLDNKFKKPNPLDVQMLAEACKLKNYESNFETGIKTICYYNVMIDLQQATSEEHHFDSEKFKDGKELITKGMGEIHKNITSGRFDNARQALGQILHTLQDFYSHSNWIELGNTKPYSALINPNDQLKNLADEKMPTCEESCPDGKCGAMILKNILAEKILTSGYFGLISKKPKGKCSHGGVVDSTTGIGRSWDGINKDYSTSSHGAHHNKAADVAIDATVELLEMIFKETDGQTFLRLVGLHKEKPKGKWKALLFSLFTDRYPDAAQQPNEIVEPEMN